MRAGIGSQQGFGSSATAGIGSGAVQASVCCRAARQGGINRPRGHVTGSGSLPHTPLYRIHRFHRRQHQLAGHGTAASTDSCAGVGRARSGQLLARQVRHTHPLQRDLAVHPRSARTHARHTPHSLTPTHHNRSTTIHIKCTIVVDLVYERVCGARLSFGGKGAAERAPCCGGPSALRSDHPLGRLLQPVHCCCRHAAGRRLLSSDAPGQ